MIERLIRVATAPVYVPVAVAMWVYFYVTDMQGFSDFIDSLTEEN